MDGSVKAFKTAPRCRNASSRRRMPMPMPHNHAATSSEPHCQAAVPWPGRPRRTRYAVGCMPVVDDDRSGPAINAKLPVDDRLGAAVTIAISAEVEPNLVVRIGERRIGRAANHVLEVGTGVAAQSAAGILMRVRAVVSIRLQTPHVQRHDALSPAGVDRLHSGPGSDRHRRVVRKRFAVNAEHALGADPGCIGLSRYGITQPVHGKTGQGDHRRSHNPT